jgi:hypothetical protein
MLGVVREASEADQMPAWTAQSPSSIEEAETVRDVLRILLDHRESLKIGAPHVFIMNNTLRSLDVIVKRGSITPEERTGMVRAARIVLLSIL